MYKSNSIHPEYLTGTLPRSCSSRITWPPLPCPPKKYLKHPYRFNPVYYKHSFSLGLYHVDDNKLTMFKMIPGACTRLRAIHTNVPYFCDIIGDWLLSHPSQPASLAMALEDYFQSNHPTIQQICGSISYPPDNGTAWMQSIQNKSSILFRASDAWLKEGRKSHAWIISSGHVDDIMDPLLHIYGFRPVHGLPQYLSSSRGELQGITAVSVTVKLLMDFHSTSCKVKVVCNNTGMISKCSRPSNISLKCQRTANLDLFLTQSKVSKDVDLKLE